MLCGAHPSSSGAVALEELRPLLCGGGGGKARIELDTIFVAIDGPIDWTVVLFRIIEAPKYGEEYVFHGGVRKEA